MSIVLNDVSMTYGDQELFRHVHLELHPAERLALLGRNGSGKTTLLRLIEGTLAPAQGQISRSGTLAYLPQFSELRQGTLLEAIRPATLTSAHHHLQDWAGRLVQPTPEVLEGFAAAEEQFRLLGGYAFEQRATEVLDALHLHPQWSTQALSGGQRRRTLLAQLLLTPADTYLLDEPTNHLDWPSLEWLEGWVQASPAAFLIVSHDRAFLDATVTRCAELEREVLREYPGNYSAAMGVKSTLQEARERQYQAHRRKTQALEQERRHVQQKAASADRYNHKRKKPGNKKHAKMRAQDVARTLARRAKALERRLDRMDAPERLLSERQLVRVQLHSRDHGPNDVLDLREVRVELSGQTILRDVNLYVGRGEKIAVIGPNGGGKSTLLHTLLTHRAPCSGTVRRGDLAVQWAGQQHEELQPFQTVQDALRAVNPALGDQQLYEVLARLGLPRHLRHPLEALSGGQRTRLALARLSLTTAGLLVLDEPTNHLDLVAIEALQTVLKAYEGTLIFASHDRALVTEVATRFWWVEGGAVIDLGDEWSADATEVGPERTGDLKP